MADKIEGEILEVLRASVPLEMNSVDIARAIQNTRHCASRWGRQMVPKGGIWAAWIFGHDSGWLTVALIRLERSGRIVCNFRSEEPRKDRDDASRYYYQLAA